MNTESGSKGRVSKYLANVAEVIAGLDAIVIGAIAGRLTELWEEEGTLFLCGNGGSAALANHACVDLTKCINTTLRLGYIDRAHPFRAISLAACSSLLTCLGNDLGYDQVFAEQVETFGISGDILMVISGSGNSANVLQAVHVARAKRMGIIALTGYEGGKLLTQMDFSDGSEISLHVPVRDMQQAEDAFHVAAHAIFRETMERIKESIES